jgi:hypothetical protein
VGLAMDLSWPTGACHGSTRAYWGFSLLEMAPHSNVKRVATVCQCSQQLNDDHGLMDTECALWNSLPELPTQRRRDWADGHGMCSLELAAGATQ